MAIDTAQKRSSVAGRGLFGHIPGRPDGAVSDAHERAQIGRLYSGLEYSPPPPGPTLVFRRSTALAKPHFAIRITRPGGASFPLYLPIEDVTALSFQTQLNGGFGLGSVGMAEREDGTIYAYLPVNVDVEYFSILEILAGSTVVYRGVVTNLRQDQGKTVGIEAEGVLPRGGQFQPFLPGAGTLSRLPSRSVLRESIRSHNAQGGGSFRLMPTVTSEALTVGHQASEFHGMTLWRIAEQFATEGDGDNPAWVTAYNDDVIEVGTYDEPTRADYVVSVEDLVVEPDATQVCNEVTVSYTGTDGVQREQRVRNALLGYIRGYNIAHHVTTQLKSAGQAIAFGRAYLNEHDDPTYSVTITRHWSEPLRSSIGEPKRIYLARAGEWVEVFGLGKLLIVRTDYDNLRGTGTITLGGMNSRTAAFLLAQSQRSDTALREGIDVNSGAQIM